MENLEIEYKVMIQENDFKKLIESLPLNSYQLYIQENTYYDTSDFKIKKNHLSLRIRNIENLNQYVLTLKIKAREGHLEHEVLVFNHDLQSIDEKTKIILKQYGIETCDLKVVGQLKTIRYEIKTNQYNLCFDHNFYLNQQDYEVECEAQSMQEAQNIIQQYLSSKNISYVPSKLSKVARALGGQCDD